MFSDESHNEVMKQDKQLTQEYSNKRAGPANQRHNWDLDFSPLSSAPASKSSITSLSNAINLLGSEFCLPSQVFFQIPTPQLNWTLFHEDVPLFPWLVVVTLNGLTCWVGKSLSSLFSDVDFACSARTGAAITCSLAKFSCQTFQTFTRKRGQAMTSQLPTAWLQLQQYFANIVWFISPPMRQFTCLFGFSIISKPQISHSICRYFAMHKS